MSNFFISSEMMMSWKRRGEKERGGGREERVRRRWDKGRVYSGVECSGLMCMV